MKRFVLLVLALVPVASHAEEAKLYLQLGHSDEVTSVAFSPDGHFVLTGSRDHTARLWDAASGAEIRQFRGHSEALFSVAFSPDGRFVLTGGMDSTARLWEAATGTETRRFRGHSGDVTSVAFSPDGRFVLTGGEDRTARLWDALSGAEIRRFQGHASRVITVAFSADGRFVLTGSTDDKGARLWDAASGAEIRRFRGHSGSVTSVAFSPDGRCVLTGSDDRTARLWDTASGGEIRKFQGHSNEVASVAFSPDGRFVVTGSLDMTARLWDAANGSEIRVLQPVSDRLEASVAFSPDGRFVLAGSNDRTARVWDVASGAEVRKFQGHSRAVASVAFSPDGRFLLNGSDEGAAHLWDAAGGAEIRRFQGHSTAVAAVAFSPDGRFALTGSWDETARLWDAASGAEIRRFQGHSGTVTAVAFSPDGRFALTGGQDNTARLWDTAGGTEIRTFKPKVFGRVDCVAFSPDGRFVLTGGLLSIARLWDTASGAEIREFRGHSNVVSVAFSPDGRFVLTGSWDGTARLWNAASGTEIRKFQGHSDKVTSVAFSRDGRYVLTGSEDRTARLWDTASGAGIGTFHGHAETVTSVAFSRDERFLVTGSSDGTSRLWQTLTGKWLATLVSFREGGWAVVDQEGRYDASDPDSAPGFHFVAGTDVIELGQLKRRFYTPDLLGRIWREEKFDAIAASLKDVKLVPGIELVTSGRDTAQATLRLTNRSGGLGRIVVKVNGREVPLPTHGVSSYKPDDASAELRLDLSAATLSADGHNVVQVSAFNGENSIESRGFGVNWETKPVADATAPRIFVIVVGTSQYANERMNLRYSAKDAMEIGNALRLAAVGLYSDAARVVVTVLASGTAREPTKDNIRAAFDMVARQSRAEDVLIVYFAGHGRVVRTERDQYYYFTREATSADVEADAALRNATTVSSTELNEWLSRRNMPLKEVVVLDTCAAGAAFTDLVKLADRRDLSPDQIRAIQFLKDSTGSWILMGSAADAVSYEASRYAQGLLTYALLQGMKGAALDGDRVDVARLLAFAQRQVQDLASGVGGVQRPIISAPRGQSFPIGMLTEKDRAQIRLATPKPQLLRARVLDDNDLDSLKLEPGLRAELRAASLPVPRDGTRREPAVVYLDQVVDEVPDALIPQVRYRVAGDKVAARLRLLQNGQPVAERNVELAKSDLATVSRTLAQEIVALSGSVK